MNNSTNAKIKVLIADDSAIIRGILEKSLKVDTRFEVVALVSNARKAIDYVKTHPVDIVISDIDMPELNGIEALQILTGELNIPVAIFSEDRTQKENAIANGAALFEVKPPLSALSTGGLKPFIDKVYNKAKTLNAHKSHTVINTENVNFASFKVLCIGASTGGPTAVQVFLTGLGNNFPLPILYTQHLDVDADKKMAAWFDMSCPNLSVSLAKDGEVAKAGHVYLAPANVHLVIDYINSNGEPILKLSNEPAERFLRPAVNKLFRSAAEHYKNACLAVLMTGMGRDGAEGCKEIVDNGGYTIVEDKSTCAVFGMPAAAIELNAANEVLPRPKIAPRVLQLVRSK